MLSPRQKAARKAARTRAANAASMKRWLELDKPAHERTVSIVNKRLSETPHRPVLVRFVGGPGRLKLAKGDGMGVLVKVLGTGLTWRVRMNGYKGKPRDWHARFWEVV